MKKQTYNKVRRANVMTILKLFTRIIILRPCSLKSPRTYYSEILPSIYLYNLKQTKLFAFIIT